MKFLLFTSILASALCVGAKQKPVQTQDNLSYVVTVSDDSDWKHCSKIVCAIAKAEGNGDGTCKKFSFIKVLQVNLTTKGLDILNQVNSCYMTVEAEEEVHANPKLGTSN